jgi:hypothetical protein
VVCFSRIWSVPFEAWRTGSPCLDLEHASASSGLPWGLDLPLQIAIRPTDFCHPTNLSTCTRARGSRPISRPRGMSPVARWIEGHDVSRRRRPLPPDRTLRPRVFTGVASCDRASDTPVARSWGRAALLRRLRLRSLEPRPPSPLFREEKGQGGDPVCLPSAGRSGYRAPGRSRPRPCDLDAPRERPRSGPTDNRVVVESARADILRCRPRDSPSTEPPPACLLPRPLGSVQGSWLIAFRRGHQEFQTGFSGLATAYRSLQRISTRGHAREP